MVALELVIATINRLQLYNPDITCKYQDEIDFVRGLYNDIKKQIEIGYGFSFVYRILNSFFPFKIWK